MTDARDELILAAERCIGEFGPSVPVREIVADAGQRNNSAVAYHFGTRDDLIRAVIHRRALGMDAEREAMLADSEDPGVADLVHMIVWPMFCTPYAEGSTHFARFMEKVRDHPAARLPRGDDSQPALRSILRHLRPLVIQPGEKQASRLNALATSTFALIADEERAGAAGWSQRERRRRSAELESMLVGLVTAPAAPRK